MRISLNRQLVIYSIASMCRAFMWFVLKISIWPTKLSIAEKWCQPIRAMMMSSNWYVVRARDASRIWCSRETEIWGIITKQYFPISCGWSRLTNSKCEAIESICMDSSRSLPKRKRNPRPSFAIILRGFIRSNQKPFKKLRNIQQIPWMMRKFLDITQWIAISSVY